MISIIITSFHEPNLKNCVDSFLNQVIDYAYELVVVSPDKESEELVKSYNKKNIRYFFDPGKGKSYALNLVFKESKSDILILTDGDVFVSKSSVNEIVKKFEDPKVGVVSGRPVSLDKRDSMFGYWSHFLLDIGAHEISRKKRYEKGQFLEATGYLFAIRHGVIKEIPVDVAEDTTIPYLFFKKGYKIAYAENAKVFVKWPNNMKDWLKQKKRAADAHTKLTKYYPDFPKVKSFFNEILEGFSFKVLKYPKNIKEIFWTFWLYLIRFYMWLSLFFDLKFRRREYKDAWERVDSTK
ncbi:MAG: glycosyltransferase [Nanoarchaeota archaeon]|nr:glycosyltransferase [Nanoarchaeota archaeon]